MSSSDILKYTIETTKSNSPLTITDENGEDVDNETALEIAKAIRSEYTEDSERVVYLIYSPSLQLYKVGMTKDIKARIAQLKRAVSDDALEVVHVIHCHNENDAKRKEKMLHEHWHAKHKPY